MIYANIPQNIPQERRAEINRAILASLKTSAKKIPAETVYNSYTGLGGLHGLDRKDFNSYNDYARAKKEFEMGQFFTCHDLCARMVDLASPDPSEMVLDMCCGICNFMNHLPNLYNAYGFDIDPDAVTVARYLYPQAHIETCDLRHYDPGFRFDLLLGNPPYNLDFDGCPSQLYFCRKAYDLLNPGGLMLIVVPHTFMLNEFWDKRQISEMETMFSFLGQIRLPDDIFAASGVKKFSTKIMAFLRKSEHIEMRPYNAECFLSFEELGKKIEETREARKTIRMKLRREADGMTQQAERDFQYKIDKYLFELKTHPHLRKHYDKSLALVSVFRNQKPPINCTVTEYEEWKRRRLTHAKVLAVLRRHIRHQNEVPRKEIALVKTSYGYKLKAYAPHLLDKIERREVSFRELIAAGEPLPELPRKNKKQKEQYRQAEKLIARKRKEFLRQQTPFPEMTPDPRIDAYIDRLRFRNKELQECEFTPLQKQDMGLLFQKRYSLLNWQQGSGKTAVAYHFGCYAMDRLQQVKNVIVLAPAIAVNLTWEPFLIRNGTEYIRIDEPAKLSKVPEGVFLLVSLSMMEKLQRGLKTFMKQRSNKVCLLFDESDEISNPLSRRTRLSLALFRRARYKMLATGTVTRNNVNELYPQFEMLYNNSVNMINYCPEAYFEDKDRDIVSRSNDRCGMPFPAYGGHNLFRACFSPGRTTVFGIEKHNQDIYNKKELQRLIAMTVLTRKFREFAGEKYDVHTCNVTPSAGERAVYRKVMKEFLRLCELYFTCSKDQKKEAQMRLIRQIMLLIRACSVPHTMPGYIGDRFPRKTKQVVRMIRSIPGKVTIGCTTISAVFMYERLFRELFADRPLFVIRGDVTFRRREKIIAEFEATENGLLVCTQQSLKSSANIPSCNHAILESLQWNISKMEQFYFRFIRLDSKEFTHVHFVLYEDSIEQNLMALVLTKERLNDFIKTGEVKEQSEIFDEFGISPNLVESLLRREQDDDGHFYISWGDQTVS